jgi:hypothetical protein
MTSVPVNGIQMREELIAVFAFEEWSSISFEKCAP